MKHGLYRTPEYMSWRNMISRCTNRHHPSWRHYGGRGITICDSWRKDFSCFYADMGERPPGKSLDRYPNNDGNYEPGNCRWATRREQLINSRNPHRPNDVQALAIKEGISRQCAWNRLRRNTGRPTGRPRKSALTNVQRNT